MIQYTAQAMIGICMRRPRESRGAGISAFGFASGLLAGAVDFASVSTAL
jgi:hypothetical protein